MSRLRNPSSVANATGCRLQDVTAALPHLLEALNARGVLKVDVVIGLLATVATECSFRPIQERGSKKYFEKYEHRQSLGNVQDGDGYLFRGRGFIQLTGRANYRKYGKLIGVDLLANPDLALDPVISAKLAVEYFVQRGLVQECINKDWRSVRSGVNGGYNGWERFETCVNRLTPLALMPD